MHTFDLILLFILLGFFGSGLKDGFVHSFGRLIGSIFGFLAAKAWSISVATWLGGFVPLGWARLVAFILIFAIITRLIGFGFKLIDGVFNILSIVPFLKSINAFLGGILGLVEGVLLLGGAIYLVVTFKLVPSILHWINISTVAPWIQKGFTLLLGILL